MKPVVMLAVVLLGVAACGRTADPVDVDAQRAAPGDTVLLKIGESVMLGDARIVFRAVESDSRCPVDVTCVWAGDAQVRLDAIEGAGEWQQLELHLNLEPRDVTFAGYRIQLIEVAPARKDGDTVRPHHYSVRLAISRG